MTVSKVARVAQDLVCVLARPYIWREMPGWGFIYRHLVGNYERDGFWTGATPRTVRGKLHGYEMTLDLQGWSERTTYFLGRFYDLPTQLLMQALLRPGDRFCDIGANVGMLTLLGSRLVGEQGFVDAVEPNPDCCKRLMDLVTRNRINNVRLYRVALADRPGRLPLSIKSINSGEGTLTSVRNVPGFNIEVMVEVTTGDSLLADVKPAPTLIKIDIEGFECQALAGLQGTLMRHRPVVSTEIVPTHLARAGKSVEDLFKAFKALDYQCYSLGLRRSGFRHTLHLPICATSGPFDNNVLWVPRAGSAGTRARHLLPLEGYF